MTAIKRPDHEPKVERYYPDVVAPAKELKKLAAAENPEFQILWDQAWEWMKIPSSMIFLKMVVSVGKDAWDYARTGRKF